MANINFYLDQVFKKENKKRESEIAKKCRKENKAYPESILNPKPTSIYLIFSFASDDLIKVRTDQKIKPYHWNFKKNEPKPGVSVGMDIKEELDRISSEVTKLYNANKKNQYFSRGELSDGIKEIVQGKISIKKGNFYEVFDEYIVAQRITKDPVLRYEDLFIFKILRTKI